MMVCSLPAGLRILTRRQLSSVRVGEDALGKAAQGARPPTAAGPPSAARQRASLLFVGLVLNVRGYVVQPALGLVVLGIGS